MVEVEGERVQLYMEGLMIFTLDEKKKKLEAGILSVNDGHQLRVRAFSRKTYAGSRAPASWKKGGNESLPDQELRRYNTGLISFNSKSGAIASAPPSVALQNSEMWMPFELIPDIEEILGREVFLSRKSVKPVLSITGADFFSVLKPEHVESVRPASRQVAGRGFIPTLRIEKDQVSTVKRQVSGSIKNAAVASDGLGSVAKNLAIRAYTAATIITLNEGQELVCVLKGRQGSRELFKVKYAPGQEAKVIVENAVLPHDTHPTAEQGTDHAAGHGTDHEEDPAHFFHFLHYYQALNPVAGEKQFVLANKEMLLDFLDNRGLTVETELPSKLDTQGPPTGGGNPNCPSMRKHRPMFANNPGAGPGRPHH